MTDLVERLRPSVLVPYLCLQLVAIFVGCGQSGPLVAPVRGRVTLDGRPLESADITFHVEGKSPAVGRTDQDGNYDLMYKRGVAGAPVGMNRVTITVSSELVSKPPKIPARYNTASELQEEVKAGEDNVFNFDLKSDAK